jgi:hypothetical protein
MVFMFVINLITNVITSLTVNVVVNCGSWVICKSANGIYYLYKKIRPSSLIKETTIDNVEYIMISKEEYNTLLQKDKQI